MSMLFPVKYGASIASDVGRILSPAIVVTQPEPWEALRDRFGGAPAALVMADSLERAHLEKLAKELPGDVSCVIGIGGGTAMDTAKWLHWRKKLKLFQVPSLPSVNACFTHMTALRVGDGVRYFGDAIPEMVFVDYNLMKAAPAYLLRGGIGDVFSCHTGRWDWEYAVKRGHDPAWDDFAASESLRFIKELRELSPALYKGENDAIRKLMELHRVIGKYCDDYGHSRFEEGSEHFFAYTFEHVTGRTLMHGELVALGVLIMSTLQGNKPELAREIVQAAGVRHRPDELDYTMDEIEKTLLELPAFVKREKLWYSIANDLTIGERELKMARSALEF
jgi:glycerol dehydrogenase-like iron-containing ADH family enzyme